MVIKDSELGKQKKLARNKGKDVTWYHTLL